MYKVKIMTNTDTEKLEQEINSFLSELPETNLVDIKYSSVPLAISAHTEYGVYPDSTYTAMIIYRK